jgi:drug/metabolite transporter (DMT)-like permease
MDKLKLNMLLLISIVVCEALAMSIIDYSAIHNNKLYILGIIIYGFVGYILYRLLLLSNLALTNSKWNVMSIIIVTSIAIIIFKDKVTLLQGIGILLSIVSIIMMEYEELKKIFK